jgi:hypothetical protein
MLSVQFVDVMRLRKEIGELNRSGVLSEKVKTVGVKKEGLIKSFLDAVDSIPEESDDAAKIPQSVTLFYNEIVEGTDPETPPEAKKPAKPKADRPKKAAKPKKPAAAESVEGVAYRILSGAGTDEEKEKELSEWMHLYYAEKGQTDEPFIKKRIKIYTSIARKRIIAEGPYCPAPSTNVPEEPQVEEAATVEE